MKMKRVLAMLMVLVLVAGVLAGCSSGKSGAPAPANNGVTTVTFWHAMGGTNGKAIDTLVKKFNDTHKDIQVKAVFQGSYDDLFNKLKVSGNAGPSVIQVYDIGTRYMIDSKQIVPMQQFIDADKFDTSDFEPNILAYYTVDNKLYSMPFNTSTPILYYNKTAFKAAGLDPNKPPTTWDEVAADAKALTKKDASGKTTQYGVSFAIYGWFFEQFMARQGALYVDNGNGRDGLATKAVFNSPDGVNFLTWWQGMVKSGVAGNFGRATADTQKAFQAGTTAMFVDSTAVLRAQIDGVNGKFDIGTAFLPYPAGKTQGGVAVGGGSLWMMKNRPDAEQKAAWEFIKWLSEPEQQSFWSISSGYFPVRKSATKQPDLVSFIQKYPQFQTALDQLHASPINRATQGGLIGVFPQARQTIEGAIEQVLLNKQTPQEALDKAAATVTTAIQNYNKTIGK